MLGPLSLTTEGALVVLVVAAGVIMVTGGRMAATADRLADVTGLGEAFVGAVLVGAATSLPDIVATAQPALHGLAEQAAANAVGGVLAQTAFLAVADLAYRRANLEHAAASLPNVFQAGMLVTFLSMIGFALGAPHLALGPLHVTSLVLPLAYWYGLRILLEVKDRPLWRPTATPETRVDDPDDDSARGASSRREWIRFGVLAVVLAVAGWAIATVGEVVVAQADISQGAVGALLTAVATSSAELVVSVAAVRRGALTLAVANIIGGNTFDTLLMVVADAFYLDAPIYSALGPDVFVLVSASILVTTVLLVGMLRRQRQGVVGIGTESALVLGIYAATALVLI